MNHGQDNQPAPELDELEQAAADEHKAALERGGNRWAIGIVAALAAVVGLCMWNGSKPHKATDDETRNDAKRACQERFIPDRLKAPATAKYADVTVSVAAEEYTVAGSVDSQNSFGALVRSSFTCVIHSSGDQWTLDSASVS